MALTVVKEVFINLCTVLFDVQYVCVCKQYMYKQSTSQHAVIFVTDLKGFRKSAFLAGKTVLDQHMAHLNWQSNVQ